MNKCDGCGKNRRGFLKNVGTNTNIILWCKSCVELDRKKHSPGGELYQQSAGHFGPSDN